MVLEMIHATKIRILWHKCGEMPRLFIVCLSIFGRRTTSRTPDQCTSAVIKRRLSACVRTLSHCVSRSRSSSASVVRQLATAKT